MIQAIETSYSGYRFRSRLEARWAVFFDALSIRWEYEKEGYDLGDGMWYLPDFWLPRERIWVEIKGEEPSEAECQACAVLADGTGTSIVLIQGIPGILQSAWEDRPTCMAMAFHGWNCPDRRVFPFGACLYEHYFLSEYGLVIHLAAAGFDPPPPGQDRITVQRLVELDRDYWRKTYGGEHPHWKYGICDKPLNLCIRDDGCLYFDLFVAGTSVDPQIATALSAARSARFEYGETPDARVH